MLSDNRQFGRIKHYGEPIKKVRPSVGCLKLKHKSGKFEVLEQNMPFPRLQFVKKLWMEKGYKSEDLIITY